MFVISVSRREVSDSCATVGSYAESGVSDIRCVTAQKSAVLKSCI